MKATTIAALVIVLSTGCAIAGAGAPVPEGSQSPFIRASKCSARRCGLSRCLENGVAEW